MNRILYNNLTTKKVDSFESNNFSIKFRPNWRQIRKIGNKTISDFINLKNYIGILQISSFQHSDKNYVFDLNESISEIEQSGHKAEIKNISEYQSVVYALNYKDENLYQFRFEFGYKNKRLFITLTFDSINENVIENNYNEIVKILNSIKFKE
ncbi:hypothetical protein [Mariniflexile sp. HMF6888]|uniref:hypothetical protein n=1 Tax=Mariniflexile sp. HMF6888 TaxID=3373086 RepID=UPI0037961149